MKPGDPIQCPHCGADSFLKKEAVMDGWTKVGEVLKCASCSAVIADCSREESPAQKQSDAADRFKKLLRLSFYTGDHKRDHCRRDQDQDHHIFELLRKFLQIRLFLLFLQFVLVIPLTIFLYLPLIQTVLHI